MSYRDVSESLKSYRDRVAGDLDAARDAARDAAARAAKVQVLERELAETDALLAKMRGPRALPLLEDVAVAAPCTASWEQMVGDDTVRFCGHCERNVYNLSALPRHEAEALLGAREGKMCVRLYKRADGTVLTSDCPVGVTRRRRRRAVAGVVGGGLLAAGAALTATAGVATQGAVARPGVMRSAVPVMGAPPPMMGEPVVRQDGDAPLQPQRQQGGATAPQVKAPPTRHVVQPLMGKVSRRP